MPIQVDSSVFEVSIELWDRIVAKNNFLLLQVNRLKLCDLLKVCSK